MTDATQRTTLQQLAAITLKGSEGAAALAEAVRRAVYCDALSVEQCSLATTLGDHGVYIRAFSALPVGLPESGEWRVRMAICRDADEDERDLSLLIDLGELSGGHALDGLTLGAAYHRIWREICEDVAGDPTEAELDYQQGGLAFEIAALAMLRIAKVAR